MEIATGYFAKVKAYVQMGYALVSIAKVNPWFIAKELKLYACDDLKPTDDILEHKDSPPEYEKKYRKEILHKTNPQKVFRSLSLIARQESVSKVVLLCYESSEKFCHRHIVAKWLSEELGLNVAEVDFKNYENPNPSLFYSDVE